MNKETMESLDFKKKPYAAPQMEVYKVKSANIIATSEQTKFGISDGQGYIEETW